MTKPFDIRDFEEIEQNPFVVVDAKDRPLARKDNGYFEFGEGTVIYFRTRESAENYLGSPLYMSDQVTPTRVLRRRTPRDTGAREDVSPFESLARTILRDLVIIMTQSPKGDVMTEAKALKAAIDFLHRT